MPRHDPRSVVTDLTSPMRCILWDDVLQQPRGNHKGNFSFFSSYDISFWTRIINRTILNIALYSSSTLPTAYQAFNSQTPTALPQSWQLSQQLRAHSKHTLHTYSSPWRQYKPLNPLQFERPHNHVTHCGQQGPGSLAAALATHPDMPWGRAPVPSLFQLQDWHPLSLSDAQPSPKKPEIAL